MAPFGAMVTETKVATSRRASLVPLVHLREVSHLVPGAISALSSLCTDDRTVTMIAEMKHSTATSADLSGVGDPGMLACFYAVGGAARVSVITRPSAARGPLKDLDAARASVDLPVLANDPVVTPYQVHKARAHDADLLMLDVRLETLVSEGLIERVHFLGMGAVVGVRTRHEVLTAADTGACIATIDARDPGTLAVNRNLFDRVTDILLTQVVRIATGGARGLHDVTSFARCGADVVLVGEAIIRSIDPQQFAAESTAADVHPALIPPAHREAL